MRILLIFSFSMIFSLSANAQFGKLLDKAKDSDVYKKAESVISDDGELEDDTGSDVPSFQPRPFPSTLKRMTSSFLVCGILLLPFLGLIGPITMGGMPMLTGSFTCDFFMYAMGILARQNGWLEQPLVKQMDISPWTLRLIVYALPGV